MKTKDLKNAYAELIEVLTLVDKKTKEPLKVPAKATDEELKTSIRKYAELIEPEDEFTEETQAIIDALMKPEEEEQALTAKSKKAGKKQPELVEKEDEEDEDEEDEDEEDEEDEDEEDEDSLISDIEGAESVMELKEIVKENDIFKPLRKGIGLVKEKGLEDLREKMLALLTENEDEEEAEEDVKPTKKAGKQPAKKEDKPKKQTNGTTLTQTRVEFLTPLIQEKRYTKKQLLELYMKKHKDENVVGVATLLTDAKNPKYNKFAKLVIQAEDGIYKFSK